MGRESQFRLTAENWKWAPFQFTRSGRKEAISVIPCPQCTTSSNNDVAISLFFLWCWCDNANGRWKKKRKRRRPLSSHLPSHLAEWIIALSSLFLFPRSLHSHAHFLLSTKGIFAEKKVSLAFEIREEKPYPIARKWKKCIFSLHDAISFFLPTFCTTTVKKAHFCSLPPPWVQLQFCAPPPPTWFMAIFESPLALLSCRHYTFFLGKE